MTVERLLECVRLLAPLVEAERQDLDTKRELSPSLLDALVAAGLFRLWIPRRLGGAELDPVSGLRVIAAASALDGSVGWSVMVAAAYGFFAGRLSGRVAAQIFGDPRAAVAAHLAPYGKAEMIKGGYRASGRWPFGSGSKHATWFLAQCTVHRDGRARPGPAGRSEMRLRGPRRLHGAGQDQEVVPVAPAAPRASDRATGARPRRAARALGGSAALTAVDDMWRTVKAGKRPTLEQRAHLRMGCVNAGVSAAEAVDIVYHLGGASSIFEANRIERCFRDVHAATQHGALAPRTLEVVGRVLLGLDPQGRL